MAVVETILESYVEAATSVEAERALDRLTGREDELPCLLGDLYDELAEHAAEETDDFDLAARLERKAISAGCSQPTLARQMLGWYLLKAGAIDEGEAVFDALLDERPDDPEILITLGHARSDAELPHAALKAFDDALVAAKRRGYAKEIQRARIERRTEREEFGLAPDEDDGLAPARRPIQRPRPVAMALTWFPLDQRHVALQHWPDLADDFTDPQAYTCRLEDRLRRLDRGLGYHPAVAPIEVNRFISWAADGGYDPSTDEARTVYAAELLRTGGTISWPPGRNDPCWCRSGIKYKRCCGAS